MDEENFENFEQTENTPYSEPLIKFENTLRDSGENDSDSLFEESVKNSSFSLRDESEEADIYGFSEEDEDDLVDHEPGDLVDLRGLFDEDAVDPNGTTLNFEEIPDDFDIDEPIEVEKLSRFGRIMNVVVLVTMILFCIIVVGFIINAALVIGAISSVKIQPRTFVNISGLDLNVANIDVAVLTESTSFGGFIKGRLDPSQEVSARIYLIDSEEDERNLKIEDAIMYVDYKAPEDINFDFGERRLIEFKGIQMKLNPHFDASRLSGFMEARDGSKFHERYPYKVIIQIRALLDVKSFFVPLPFPIDFPNFPIKIPMQTIDAIAEDIKKINLSKFDFNPKLLQLKPQDDKKQRLVLNVRQPVPKFYGPATFEISVHIPAMEMIVKQFNMTGIYGPQANPDIKKLFNKDSFHLVTAKIQPFVFVMSDIDPTPNILNIEAVIETKSTDGLMNVLNAVRDETMDKLGFLFAPTTFDPDCEPLPAVSSVDEQFEGTPFLNFMKTFWGRQPYPAASEASGPPPSFPELYDPEIDQAIDIKFNKISAVANAIGALNFSLTVKANIHYLITQYNLPLPLLMLDGKLPEISFTFHVNDKKRGLTQVASITVDHQKMEMENENEREMIFNIQINVTNLDLFSKFAIKADRLYRMAAAGIDPKKTDIAELNRVKGGSLKAKPDVSLPSHFASAFDLEFDFKDNLFGFFYEKSGRPVLKPFPPVRKKDGDEEDDDDADEEDDDNDQSQTTETPVPEKVYSRDEEIGIIKELLNILELEEEDINQRDFSIEEVILEKVEELKQCVKNDDDKYNLSSMYGKYNMAEMGKQRWEDTLAEIFAQPINIINHQKLAKVRLLLKSWEDLKRIQPVDQFPQVSSVFIHLDSKKTEMKIELAASLAMPVNKFDDHIRIQWENFNVSLGSNSVDGRLVQAEFLPGILDYSLKEGRFYSRNNDNVRLNAKIGPGDGSVTTKTWMTTLKTFHSHFLDESKILVPFILNLDSVEFQIFLPGPGLNQAVDKDVEDRDRGRPSFFDNLSKSYFDFIGYGFYRLIFNAILPNPDTCPNGSSIYNIEIELPPTAGYLFTKTGESTPECVAAINTAEPLRLWTQIVDGVLYNMYSVADGLQEQKLKIQGRLPSSESDPIISSFKSVIDLQDLSVRENYPRSEDKHNEHEHPLMKTGLIYPIITPNEKRFTLSTVVPVTIEFLNFAHFVKVMDDFSEHKHIQIFVGDPLTSVSEFHSDNIPESLMNNLIGHVASMYPSHFNPPAQLDADTEADTDADADADTEAADAEVEKADRDISVSGNIILSVVANSSSPEELNLTVKITIPEQIAKLNSKEIPEEDPSYIPFDSSDALENVQSRFIHPIIRWGRTKIRFTFKKFNVELSISPGDIKIADNGNRILFDNLMNFEFGLLVKSRTERNMTNAEQKRAFRQIKELFRTTSIRQIFKRCLDNYNETTDYMKEYPDRIIKTTSSVRYGESARSRFHFFGAADMESLFALHGVIARKISPKNGKTTVNKDDPSYIDFGILIKLGKAPAASEGDGMMLYIAESGDRCKLPTLSLPCFFTNFCSAEQLSYSRLNERGLLTNGENIPVNLHIRDTFQPLTASIASGFSTFLTLFYMETYPKSLEWRLSVPHEQIVGMEMNGQGMFVGKADPLYIVKIAEIPYPQLRAIEDDPKPDVSRGAMEEGAQPAYSDQGAMLVDYENVRNFEAGDFYQQELVQPFKDEVIITVKAQIPDSLPGLLRTTLWPMFVPPLDTFSLHPPLLNVKGKVNMGEMVQLGHPTMAMTLSDSMDYTRIEEDGSKDIEKPSLLVKLFAAFIEESSGSGIDLHKITTKGQEPSCSRFHYSCSLNNLGVNSTSIYQISRGFLTSGESVHLVIWSQFPWVLGSIGFDFGEAVHGKIYLPTRSGKPVIVEGSMSRHHMIGNVARVRIDLRIPFQYFYQIFKLLQPILSHYMEQYFATRCIDPSWMINGIAGRFIDFKELENNPLAGDFIIGDNFEFKTEFILPNELLKRPEISLTSRTQVFLTKLKNTHLSDRTDLLHRQEDQTNYRDTYSIIDKYRKEAPQAVACIYTNANDMLLEAKKQRYLWDTLDLSQTRVYYADALKGIYPNQPINIFFQLRSVDHFPVCGLRQGVNGLAVAIEYIRPRRPFELLFNNESYFADPPTEYVPAVFDPISSVFVIKHAFPHTGRYKLYASLVTYERKLNKLKYKEIKFSEAYVKNVR